MQIIGNEIIHFQGIKVPEYIIVERDENGVVKGDFEEHDEYIVLNGIYFFREI